MAPPTARVRVVWILIDGVGDVGLPEFGKRTPLQHFDMPCCDAIAAAGVSGLMDPVQAGLACGSDTAHLSLFGYDPRQYYRGRGAFETMGAGLDMLPGDIAFKVLVPLPRAASRRSPRDRRHGPLRVHARDRVSGAVGLPARILRAPRRAYGS